MWVVILRFFSSAKLFLFKSTFYIFQVVVVEIFFLLLFEIALSFLLDVICVKDASWNRKQFPAKRFPLAILRDLDVISCWIVSSGNRGEKWLKRCGISGIIHPPLSNTEHHLSAIFVKYVVFRSFLLKQVEQKSTQHDIRTKGSKLDFFFFFSLFFFLARCQPPFFFRQLFTALSLFPLFCIYLFDAPFAPVFNYPLLSFLYCVLYILLHVMLKTSSFNVQKCHCYQFEIEPSVSLIDYRWTIYSIRLYR